jgi:hypothetical protein
VFTFVKAIPSTGQQQHDPVHIVIPSSINIAVFSEFCKLLGLRIFDDVCFNNFLLKLQRAVRQAMRHSSSVSPFLSNLSDSY